MEKVNSCTIPLREEFVQYLQERPEAPNTSIDTAKTYGSRLRSMNDQYLSQIFEEEQLPFHANDSVPRIKEMISILDICIQAIENNMAQEDTPKTMLQKLKSYVRVARLYKDFLVQKHNTQNI